MQVLNRVVQSLLVALLIIGIFASMARNAYGFTFIGVSCFGLALLYLIQLIWKLIEDFSSLEKNDKLILLELFLLASMLLLFGLRAFYIYLPGGEFIFVFVCCFLAVLYSYTAWSIWRREKMINTPFAINILLFYTAVIFFFLSMVARILTSWSIVLGVVGMLVSIPFIISILRNQNFETSNKPITLFQFVTSSKNKAGLLFLFFISSALYTGLSQIGFIPEIENSERPKAYIELINSAESGNEKPVEGKYQHERYKEEMEKFQKRHNNAK